MLTPDSTLKDYAEAYDQLQLLACHLLVLLGGEAHLTEALLNEGPPFDTFEVDEDKARGGYVVRFAESPSVSTQEETKEGETDERRA